MSDRRLHPAWIYAATLLALGLVPGSVALIGGGLARAARHPKPSPLESINAGLP